MIMEIWRGDCGKQYNHWLCRFLLKDASAVPTGPHSSEEFSK